MSRLPGFLQGDELWRHNKRWQHKTSELKKWQKVQLKAKLLLPTGLISTAHVDKELHSRVISAMKIDSISFLARHNKVILQFGAAILDWRRLGERTRTTYRKGCASWLGFSLNCVREAMRRRRSLKITSTPQSLTMWYRLWKSCAGATRNPD